LIIKNQSLTSLFMVVSWITRWYNIGVFGKIFHTLDFCLRRELLDCETVLDLGCGPSSPLKNCSNVKYSVGVEAFIPYLEESKKKRIHSEYLNKKIEELDFLENSFDAVIIIEALEHLSEEEGLNILAQAEKWAKKKVIVSSPNGFVPQKEIDGNLLQKHLSGWNYLTMKKLGFKSWGLAGLKVLRQEVDSNTMGDDLTASIRFRPRLMWFMVAALSQIVVYYFPLLAFELFSVKNIKK